MTAWDVRYARQFGEQLAGLPDPVYDRVEASIDVIAANPGLARGYDPTYEAARPPVPCRCYPVPRTTKVIYLFADEGMNFNEPVDPAEPKEPARQPASSTVTGKASASAAKSPAKSPASPLAKTGDLFDGGLVAMLAGAGLGFLLVGCRRRAIS